MVLPSTPRDAIPNHAAWISTAPMIAPGVRTPVPASEYPALHRVLGPESLARLLNISTVSLRRYQSGARTTPDRVGARLHVLALMVGDLAGAYNEAGIRRWFVRPRTVLENRAPADILTAGWRPEEPGPRQVRDLATALTASPAT